MVSAFADDDITRLIYAQQIGGSFFGVNGQEWHCLMKLTNVRRCPPRGTNIISLIKGKRLDLVGINCSEPLQVSFNAFQKQAMLCDRAGLRAIDTSVQIAEGRCWFVMADQHHTPDWKQLLPCLHQWHQWQPFVSNHHHRQELFTQFENTLLGHNTNLLPAIPDSKQALLLADWMWRHPARL